LTCFLSSFISFLRFTVFFSQKRGFPLKAGGSPAILAFKTWQYILKYGWCGVRFVFVVISLLHCFLWRSLAIFGRAFSIVVHFCRYNLPLWCSQFSPLQLTRPHPIVASLFVLVPSLNFPRSSLSIKTGSLRFHFFFWSSSSRRRAPSIALLDAGRGE
jgi:hypothetical protein